MICLKVKYQDEIRRISVDDALMDSSWDNILKQITTRFGDSLPRPFCVKYLDDEEEWITIDSSAELKEAIRISKTPLRLSIVPLKSSAVPVLSGFDLLRRRYESSPVMNEDANNQEIDFDAINYEASSEAIKQQVTDLKLLASFRIKQLRQRAKDLYNEANILQMNAVETKKRGKRVKQQYHDLQKKTRKVIQTAKAVLKTRAKDKKRSSSSQTTNTLSPQSFLSNELNGVLKEIADEIDGLNPKKQQFVKFEQTPDQSSSSSESSSDEEEYEQDEEQYEAEEVPEHTEVEEIEQEEEEEESESEEEEEEEEYDNNEDDIQYDIIEENIVTEEDNRCLQDSQMTVETEQEEEEEEYHYEDEDESETDDHLLLNDSQMTTESNDTSNNNDDHLLLLNESQMSTSNIPLRVEEEEEDYHDDEEDQHTSVTESTSSSTSSSDDEEEEEYDRNNNNRIIEEEIQRDMAEAEKSVDAMIKASEKKFEEELIEKNNNHQQTQQQQQKKPSSILSFFSSIFEPSNKNKKVNNNNNSTPIVPPPAVEIEQVAVVDAVSPVANLIDEDVSPIETPSSPILNNNNDIEEDIVVEDVVESLPPVYEPEVVNVKPEENLFASSISLLNEMGWTDNQKNQQILGKYNGDISEAIRELLEC